MSALPHLRYYHQKINDRQTLTMRAWSEARKAEYDYGVQLRKIARQVSQIVAALSDPNNPSDQRLPDTLNQFGQFIRPWAEVVARRMIADVGRRDLRTWNNRAHMMGTLIHREIETAPTGLEMQKILADQVSLISSLPREAAQRVQALAIHGLTHSIRAEEIAKEIANTGLVTMARANTIARTEVGRTATAFTMVRSKFVGSTQFVWRTAKDNQVRPTHRVLEGKAFDWDSPPFTDPPNIHSLPGSIFNCRCYAEPIVPEM